MRLLVLGCLLLVACGGSPAPTLASRLDGTWNSPIGTLTLDTEAGTFNFAGMGGTTDAKLVIVSEQGNTVVATVDGVTNTLTLADDGRLMVAQEGKLPIVFTRAP